MAQRSKTIVITGANRGIGFQAACDLSEAGHRVIITSRDQQKGREALKLIHRDAYFCPLDVTDEKMVSNFVQFVKQEVGTIDVLINNAGIVLEKYPKEDLEIPLTTSPEVFRKTIETNLIGAYSVTQAISPYFDRRHRCDIINISSGMGALSEMGRGFPAYRISKAALNALTVYLSVELQQSNIHVNSVCPGWVRTELGGPNAPRSVEEGTTGIRWIVDEEPDINGRFIRDRDLLEF